MMFRGNIQIPVGGLAYSGMKYHLLFIPALPGTSSILMVKL